MKKFVKLSILQTGVCTCVSCVHPCASACLLMFGFHLSFCYSRNIASVLVLLLLVLILIVVPHHVPYKRNKKKNVSMKINEPYEHVPKVAA